MSGIISQNTLLGSGLIKTPAGGGAWNFISKQTASSSATISFTSGIDSTYKNYLFTFTNIHGSENAGLDFKASVDSGSNYGVATTTSAFMCEEGESTDPSLGYRTSEDHAQATGAIKLAEGFGFDNDQSASGYLQLFNPSSTTFVKHFLGRFHSCHSADYADDAFKSGYVNTTSAVDAIQFLMSAGTMDSGDICLYGIST